MPTQLNVDSTGGVELSLLVKWKSVSGAAGEKTRLHRLSLKQLEDIDKLGKGMLVRWPPGWADTTHHNPMQAACQKGSWTERSRRNHGLTT